MSTPYIVDLVVEDSDGNVVGVSSKGLTIQFAPGEKVTRAGFLASQAALALKYNLDFTLMNTTGV